MLWFTSDIHAGHFNIIRLTSRPFDSVEEMDKALIDNWNGCVGHDDTIYVLGDFTLSGPSKAVEYLKQLKGHIKVLPGSHDHRWVKRFPSVLSQSGHKVELMPPLMSIEVPIDGNKQVIVLCHYALRTWDRQHHGAWALFAHSHGTLPPYSRSFDVGVDCWNYRPVSLDDVIKRIKAFDLGTYCQTCGGSGEVDSGGVTPWDAPINILCPMCKGSGFYQNRD